MLRLWCVDRTAHSWDLTPSGFNSMYAERDLNQGPKPCDPVSWFPHRLDAKIDCVNRKIAKGM
jgi:hypothetical protein